jgi:uncharacterized protein YeaO (DUF488 family)
MIRLKRAYDDPAGEDGQRYLVDRLWPRGVTKEALRIEAWLKDAAPSPELRKWFGHDRAKWDAFVERYTRELDENTDAWAPLLEAARAGTVTLVYATKDTEKNSAVILRDVLERQLRDLPDLT